MKSFVATMCFFMLGALFVMPALAGVEDAPEGADPDTFYDSVDDSGEEIYLENGGTTLIFDKSSGNMILWTDAKGQVLADSPPSEAQNDTDSAEAPESLLLDNGSNRSECDVWGGQEVEGHPILIDVINWNGDCNPFALYLYNGTNSWGGPLDMLLTPPEVFHPMEYGTAYAPSWNGSWLHHTWSVYHMMEIHGHHLGAEFDAPMGNVPSLIEADGEDPLFTVEAEVLVQVDGTVRWRNIEVVWDNGGDPYSVEAEAFGIYGVQYPIIRGFDTGHAYAPGSNQDYLVAPVKDGLLLNNPLYNIWNPVPPPQRGTDFENMEPRRWGEQIELKVKEDSPGIISTWVRNYPDGYELTMPFLAYYTTDTGRSAGTYFVIPDTTMKAKSFIVRARDNTGDAAPDRFDFAYVHWSDDVCGRYLPDIDPDDFGANGRKVCQWGIKDFGPTTYEVRAEPLTERNWYQPVERYRDWARANAPWWGTLNKNRPLSAFYQYAGIAVRGLGSEQDVAFDDPSYDNFVEAFHRLLKQETPSGTPADDARVLFIQSWDWSISGLYERASFFGRGAKSSGTSTNNLEYWEATFGPAGSETRNRDAIVRDADAGSPYYNANKAGDYLVPYMDFLSLCFDGGPVILEKEFCDGFTWAGYNRDRRFPIASNAGAPWIDRRIFPDSGGSLDDYGKVRINPALADARGFLANRDRKIVADPFQLATSPARFKPLSGFYHDVGLSFNVALSFRAHAAFDDGQRKIPEYYPSYGSTAARFQVGRGGFTYQAARDLYSDIRNNSGTPHLMGTERMTELFVDLQDFYSGGENADGPIKRLDVAEAPLDDCDGYFQNENKWIHDGSGIEIPLLQYAYHSAMPVRTSQMTVSGGSGGGRTSDHDIGDIFYWLAARQYLFYGGIGWLAYESTTADILSFPDPGGVVQIPSGMNVNGRTYQSGWSRKFPPETPAAPQSGRDVGRYECDPEDPLSTFCDFGDPAKVKFLRMLAYLRDYRLAKFLAFGDMRRAGAYVFLAPVPVAAPFQYDYYFARSQQTDSCGALPCLADECLEHKSSGHLGPFPGERFVHNSWKNIPTLPTQKPEIVYVLANLNDSTLNLDYTVNISAEYGATPGYACMLTFSPNVENYPNWSGTAPWTVNQTRTFTNISIPAKNVTVIKIKPTSACSP